MMMVDAVMSKSVKCDSKYVPVVPGHDLTLGRRDLGIKKKETKQKKKLFLKKCFMITAS